MQERICHLGTLLFFVFLGIPVITSAQQCLENQLHDEFFLDVTSRGYVTCATDGNLAGTNVSDSCVLERFNQPCTDNPACKIDQVITREHFFEIIDPAEYQAMLKDTTKAERKAGMDIAMQMITFNMSLATVRQKLLDIYPAPSAPLTNQAIKDAQKKNASRAQIVCGRSGTINDVSCGLRGTGCP